MVFPLDGRVFIFKSSFSGGIATLSLDCGSIRIHRLDSSNQDLEEVKHYEFKQDIESLRIIRDKVFVQSPDGLYLWTDAFRHIKQF